MIIYIYIYTCVCVCVMQNRKSTQLHEGNRAVIYSRILYRNLSKVHVLNWILCSVMKKQWAKYTYPLIKNFLYKMLWYIMSKSRNWIKLISLRATAKKPVLRTLSCKFLQNFQQQQKKKLCRRTNNWLLTNELRRVAYISRLVIVRLRRITKSDN